MNVTNKKQHKNSPCPSLKLASEYKVQLLHPETITEFTFRQKIINILFIVWNVGKYVLYAFQHNSIKNYKTYFCSLTDRQTNKIFKNYMLIDQRNLHKKIRTVSQLEANIIAYSSKWSWQTEGQRDHFTVLYF